jgi:hypothetical protein
MKTVFIDSYTPWGTSARTLDFRYRGKLLFSSTVQGNINDVIQEEERLKAIAKTQGFTHARYFEGKPFKL